MDDVTVVFTLNGHEHEVKMSAEESLLEAALKARLNPPYSCLEGVCATCSAWLEQGEVRMAEGDLDERARDRVFRTCQAQPKSKFLRVNYDKISV
jgi:ferredoxin